MIDTNFLKFCKYLEKNYYQCHHHYNIGPKTSYACMGVLYAREVLVYQEDFSHFNHFKSYCACNFPLVNSIYNLNQQYHSSHLNNNICDHVPLPFKSANNAFWLTYVINQRGRNSSLWPLLSFTIQLRIWDLNSQHAVLQFILYYITTSLTMSWFTLIWLIGLYHRIH